MNRPIPDKGIVRLSVNLAPDVAEALQVMALDEDVTITEQIRRCICDRYLARTAMIDMSDELNALQYEQLELVTEEEVLGLGNLE